MRKSKLSPTKISTYLACPVKYKWSYIDPRGKWYMRSKHYYSFGSSLHKVLQRFHDNQDQGVKTIHEALSSLEENWMQAGYQSQEDMLNALRVGKEMIQTYIEELLVTPTQYETIHVEKLFQMDLGEFILQGRIDRVDLIDENSYEVIDYKSGRQAVFEEDVKNDIAMACYQLLITFKYPHSTVKTSIIALQNNQKASASLSPEELEVFKNDIIFLGNEILQRDYENLTPTFKEDLCPHCDFLSLCKRDPLFRESLPDELLKPTDGPKS